MNQKRFDIQAVELSLPIEQAFTYIADPLKLPIWTNAFKTIHGEQAVLQTPQGQVDITLKVITSSEAGTIDWCMTFPDGSIAFAYSRLTPLDSLSCIYSFTLMAPPVPLELLEGALAEQKQILAHELETLKGLLEDD